MRFRISMGERPIQVARGGSQRRQGPIARRQAGDVRTDHLGRRSGVTVAAAALEVAALAVLGLTETHHDILGTTGAIAVLIAVIAAVLAGPLVGCLTALAGGVAFFGFVTHWGETAPLTATIASVVVWSLSAVIVGVVADRLRHQRAARRAAEDEAALLHARLESNLLPHLESQHGGLHLMWRYLPSEDRLGISGDFYDAATTPDGRLAVVIGDVVGHGPDAAALGATLRASWHASYSQVHQTNGWWPHSLACSRARNRHWMPS